MENDTFVDDLHVFSIAIKFPDAILYVYELLYICYSISMHVFGCLAICLCPMDVPPISPKPALFFGSTSPHHHEAASVEASCARL